MDFRVTFPLMYYLNLARRQDRRMECEEEFEKAGLQVERFPAVDGRWAQRVRGFQSAGKYAHTLGVPFAEAATWSADHGSMPTLRLRGVARQVEWDERAKVLGHGR